jgi:magnesium chelatase subunit D
MPDACPSRWEDACTCAALLAVDPVGVGGICVRSAPGPVRDRWLQLSSELAPERGPLRKIPLNICDSRLLGGLDLAATLRAGRPIAETGILAESDGGIVALSMAERLPASLAAKIALVMDSGEVMLERDGFARRIATRFTVVALDEGIDADERPPTGLLDRLALHIDLNGIPCSSAIATGFSGQQIREARARLSEVGDRTDMLVALCEAAAAVGVDSARPVLFALRVARIFAALAGRSDVSEDDAAQAARLVFAPRATRAPVHNEPATQSEQPAPESEQPATQPPEPSAETATAQPQQPPEAQPDSPDAQGPLQADSLGDRILEAVAAALPPQLVAQLSDSARGQSSRQSGRSSAEQLAQRGRPAGSRAGEWHAGARMNVIETLRAAAPWQAIRQRLRSKAGLPALTAARAATRKARKKPEAPRICVQKADFRIMRFKRQTQQTTIFLVDASGSAALNRLAEAKGAVELMLAESYVRRDRVALIAFRGTTAQLLLPPTASLVRAKRELTRLPGGGGTPLASGLDAARSLADSLQRRGEAPVVIVLTDGKPNVARDGRGNRARAEADTFNAARLMRGSSIASLMVDTAPQPRSLTAQFAQEMGARYLPLPYANAGTLALAARQCAAGPRRMANEAIHVR